MQTDSRWPVARDEDGKFSKYAWPGCYPIAHYTADDGYLCPDCANENIELCNDPDGDKQWRIVASDVLWENPDELMCDHCNRVLECAYV